MKSFNYTITDEVGIHARPAGTLAKKVKEYASTVVIAKGREECTGTETDGSYEPRCEKRRDCYSYRRR